MFFCTVISSRKLGRYNRKKIRWMGQKSKRQNQQRLLSLLAREMQACKNSKDSTPEVESRTQGSRPRPRTPKKSEAKAQAKDSLSEDRHSRGQGQECSRPRPRTQAQVLSKKKKKKKVFTKIFQAISTKKRFPKNFSSGPQNFNNSKNTAVLEPRTGQFSRTWGLEAKTKDFKMCPRGLHLCSTPLSLVDYFLLVLMFCDRNNRLWRRKILKSVFCCVRMKCLKKVNFSPRLTHYFWMWVSGAFFFSFGVYLFLLLFIFILF